MNLAAITHRSAYTQCYFVNSDKIRISINTGKDIKSVILMHDNPYINGISNKTPFVGKAVSMEIKYELKHNYIWSIELEPKYKREQYYFIISDGNEKIYMLEDDFYCESEFNKQGKFMQFFKMPWLNSSDVISVPEWVKDTIWYQILPDRFCRDGNLENRHNLREWEDEKDIMSYSDFYGGNLRGIISKIGYLKSLGITGIYLTPIFESVSNHKYNITNYEKIDPDFGTEEDLIELVKICHDNGMKLMLDAVFNHCGMAFPKWQDVIKNGQDSQYADWFFVNQIPVDNGTYKTRDGRYYSFAFEANMPKLNTNNQEVINYFAKVCKYWVEKWNIDGIRFDVGNEVSHSFLKEIRREVKRINPQVFLLGEIWHDSIQWLQGDEYDSVMNYPFMECVNDFWNDYTQTSKQLYYSMNYVYSKYQEQTNDVLFNFLDSHDVPRVLSRCNNMNDVFQQMTILCTLPGSICFYYGTEAAIEGVHDPYNRKCMPWSKINNGDLDYVMDKFKKILMISVD